MRHRATPRFWACYRGPSVEIQQLADCCHRLLLQDSRHPSLHFKRVGPFWSVRVGLHYRALAIDEAGDVLWVWIGPHAEYDTLLRR